MGNAWRLTLTTDDDAHLSCAGYNRDTFSGRKCVCLTNKDTQSTAQGQNFMTRVCNLYAGRRCQAHLQLKLERLRRALKFDKNTAKKKVYIGDQHPQAAFRKNRKEKSLTNLAGQNGCTIAKAMYHTLGTYWHRHKHTGPVSFRNFVIAMRDLCFYIDIETAPEILTAC